MALFVPVLKTILKNEGGYAHDPKDSGGETWQGIARNINPGWEGWKIIDEIKKNNPVFAKAAISGRPANLDKLLFKNTVLPGLVYDLYKINYWDVNNLDHLRDQQLAENVADCGVNCGTRTAAKMLQRAYNIAHAPNKPALLDDGDIGPKTIAAINSDSAVFIYTAYNQLRKYYYDQIIARKPSQIKFKKSWYSRIVDYKHTI